jgi:hypothetical protein
VNRREPLEELPDPLAVTVKRVRTVAVDEHTGLAVTLGMTMPRHMRPLLKDIAAAAPFGENPRKNGAGDTGADDEKPWRIAGTVAPFRQARPGRGGFHQVHSL